MGSLVAVGVLVGGTGVLVGVLVGGTGVLVEVLVGGTGVLVGVGVLVGGNGVLVGVLVGGTSVLVGGGGVLVGVLDGGNGVLVGVLVEAGSVAVGVGVGLGSTAIAESTWMRGIPVTVPPLRESFMDAPVLVSAVNMTSTEAPGSFDFNTAHALSHEELPWKCRSWISTRPREQTNRLKSLALAAK